MAGAHDDAKARSIAQTSGGGYMLKGYAQGQERLTASGIGAERLAVFPE